MLSQLSGFVPYQITSNFLNLLIILKKYFTDAWNYCFPNLLYEPHTASEDSWAHIFHCINAQKYNSHNLLSIYCLYLGCANAQYTYHIHTMTGIHSHYTFFHVRQARGTIFSVLVPNTNLMESAESYCIDRCYTYQRIEKSEEKVAYIHSIDVVCHQ